MTARFQYCDPTDGQCYFVSPLQYVDLTTSTWRVGALPWDLTVIDGTSPYGIEANGSIIIERVQPSLIGSMNVVSFIYLIMTVLVLLLITDPIVGWAQSLARQRLYDYTSFWPTGSDIPTERQFNKQLRRHYNSQATKPLQPSFAEPAVLRPDAHCTSEGLREFRDLIRSKYKTDVQVYNSRFVGEREWPNVEAMMRRSRGATLDMKTYVEQWMLARDSWSNEEWTQVQQIYQMIQHLDQSELAKVDRARARRERERADRERERMERGIPNAIPMR